jgi:hypothetical protein
MKNKVLLALLTAAITLIAGCKNKTPLPDSTATSKMIQDLILENGNQDGGNQIEIHRFEIKSIKAGESPNTARVEFNIDFTRQPTSGLSPEYQQPAPTRFSEEHQAILALEKDTWVMRELSLH